MDNLDTLNRLKQFESLMKQNLIIKFGPFLSDNKIALLNFQSFVDEDIIGKCDNNEDKMRELIVRTLLDNILDIRCKKDLEINGKVETISYGDLLQEILVSYYTKNIADSYQFTASGLSDEELMKITLLKNELGDDFDKIVLNNDANTLLAIAGNGDLIKEADNDAIKRYTENLNKNEKVDTEREEVKESFENKGQINIIYLNGRQYVKYIDSDDVVHLVETEHTNDLVSKVYKDKIKDVGPNGRINPEDFFNELTSFVNEENLTATEDVNLDYLNHEEVNMLSFIHSNSAYKDDVKDGKVTHNSDNTIHVLESSNDIVVTDTDSHDLVSSKVISQSESDLSNDLNGKTLQKEEVNDDVVLSRKEYEELCDKFKSGGNLTLEQLRALKKYEELYMQEYRTWGSVNSEVQSTAPDVQNENTIQESNVITPEEIQEKTDELIKEEGLEEAGPILRMGNGERRYAGFTNKYLIIYLVIMTICMGVIIGAALFKMTR